MPMERLVEWNSGVADASMEFIYDQSLDILPPIQMKY